MRSSFGKLTLKLRIEKQMSQSDFATEIGEPLSRVSQIEHQRVHISDHVIGEYIRVLDCNGQQAHQLRDYANFSNARLTAQKKNLAHDDVHALLAHFGAKLSPVAIAKIKNIIAEDVGERVESLEFANTKSRKQKGEKTQCTKRPSLTPARFVEICLIAHEYRLRYFQDSEKISMDYFLQAEAANTTSFDFEIVECLPPYAAGAYACIVGHKNGRTLLIEEERFRSAIRERFFNLHVLAHEFGHHVLHGDLLETDTECYLPPQELATLASDLLSEESSIGDEIYNVVDSLVEVEAECFATMLIVPWFAFLKGTELVYLAKDYGEQLDEVKRYARYFKNRAVIDQLKTKLWKLGRRDHPIFNTKSSDII